MACRLPLGFRLVPAGLGRARRRGGGDECQHVIAHRRHPARWRRKGANQTRVARAFYNFSVTGVLAGCSAPANASVLRAGLTGLAGPVQAQNLDDKPSGKKKFDGVAKPAAGPALAIPKARRLPAS